MNRKIFPLPVSDYKLEEAREVSYRATNILEREKFSIKGAFKYYIRMFYQNMDPPLGYFFGVKHTKRMLCLHVVLRPHKFSNISRHCCMT